MDVKLEKWHKCQVDKEVLKELSKKSDIKGLQHVSVFFGLLLVTGILAYQTWGTWWSVFWFLVYGNIYSFSNPLWHETGHKTAFQSKFLNELFYYISSYMANFEPTRWRYTHFVHHGNTYSTENPFDHEIEYGNDLKETPKRLIINIIPFLDLVFFKKHISFEIIQHALGIKTKVMQDSIPENAQAKANATIIDSVFKYSHLNAGMVIFSFTDGWWKAGNPNKQDIGGWAPNSSGVPYDGAPNEEYWGIVDIYRNKKQTFDTIKKRFNSFPLNHK